MTQSSRGEGVTGYKAKRDPTENGSVLRMKSVVLLVLAGVTAVLAAEYTDKYDHIDVDKILNNDRILTQYIKCLMGEGACTNEGRELKRLLPDALQTDCNKCSEKQKSTSEKVIKHLVDKRKRDFDRLLNKYDPEGHYRQKYEQRIRSN